MQATTQDVGREVKQQRSRGAAGGEEEKVQSVMISGGAAAANCGWAEHGGVDQQFASFSELAMSGVGTQYIGSLSFDGLRQVSSTFSCR